MENNERILELQQDILRMKLRHSDKVFQLCAELDQDIRVVNEKIKGLQPKEVKEVIAKVKEEVKTVK